MIKTPLCELLGIEYPIIQGGMAWIADASLAAAVSEGGGLGLIAAMNADPEWSRAEIRHAKTLTKKPFGVNIMMMSSFVDAVAQMVVDEEVQVVTTGAGNPERFMRFWLSAGIKVLPVIPSSTIAKRMENCGATAVIAEGCESGGHIGSLTTLALVPAVCDTVSIPVVAAGGIADGRSVAAAFMLGAVGVQVGTRFLVADECAIHKNYKKKIVNAKDTDTVTTGKRFGHAVRVLKNKFPDDFTKKEYDPGTTAKEVEALGVGALRLAAQKGDLERGCFMAGQSAALVKKEQPAAEMIREMFLEAEFLLRGTNQWLK